MFKAKIGRRIDLQFNEDGHLEALHNDNLIGIFEFIYGDDFPNQHIELTFMNVERAYQSAGIGYRLMAFAKLELKYFILPKPLGHFAANELTEDGLELIKYCFSKALLGPEFESQYSRR